MDASVEAWVAVVGGTSIRVVAVHFGCLTFPVRTRGVLPTNWIEVADTTGGPVACIDQLQPCGVGACPRPAGVVGAGNVDGDLAASTAATDGDGADVAVVVCTDHNLSEDTFSLVFLPAWNTLRRVTQSVVVWIAAWICLKDASRKGVTRPRVTQIATTVFGGNGAGFVGCVAVGHFACIGAEVLTGDPVVIHTRQSLQWIHHAVGSVRVASIPLWEVDVVGYASATASRASV